MSRPIMVIRIADLCEDNIKVDIRELGFPSMDWIHLFQDRDQWRFLVITEMNLWVYINACGFWIIERVVRILRRALVYGVSSNPIQGSDVFPASF